MNPTGISFSVASRIHDAFALAERRRLVMITEQSTTTEHMTPNIIDLPVLPSIPGNFPMVLPSNGMLLPSTGFMMPSNGHELLPATTAPMDFTCAVCFEKVKKGNKQQLLNCGHKFCVKCISRWLQTNQHPTCPTCRTPISR